MLIQIVIIYEWECESLCNFNTTKLGSHCEQLAGFGKVKAVVQTAPNSFYQ